MTLEQTITKPACGNGWAIVPGSSQAREMARAAVGATWRTATELSVLALATSAPVWAEYPHYAGWGWLASQAGRKAVRPVAVEARKFGVEWRYRASGAAESLPQDAALAVAVGRRLDETIAYLRRNCDGGAHPGGHTLAAIEAVPTIVAARAWLAEHKTAESASRESAAPGRAPPRARRYWALLANPDRYRVEAAVSERDEDWWTTGGSELFPGDEVIVWRSRSRKSRDRERGIVAFGTVLTEPETRADSSPFWIDSERRLRPEPRVLVRYERADGLPLWADDPGNEALLTLSVARSRGRSVFRVTGEQWAEIAALAGLERGQDSEETALIKRGIGRATDPARNKAIEQRAMEKAARCYREAGWEVEDVSSRRGLGYDIRCTRNGEELHVEVKGVSTDGSEVNLTRNEVEHAREHPRPVLFVVSGIEVSYAGDGSPVASGGTARILDPWRLGDGELAALSYSYRLPTAP